MEMDAKGKARNMIIVRGHKGEVKKLRERVVSARSLVRLVSAGSGRRGRHASYPPGQAGGAGCFFPSSVRVWVGWRDLRPRSDRGNSEAAERYLAEAGEVLLGEAIHSA